MLNYLWAGMILIGIFYGAITGNLAAVGEGALQSATEAISLCITMLGAVAFWVGLMEIAEKSGLLQVWKNGLKPVIRILFPRLQTESEAAGYILTNIIANVLGLGWAATPAGLKAMEALAEEEKKRLGVEKLEVASKDMCTFLILNISSLQLISVNMIVYRTQYGSVNPTAIILPSIVATLVSTLVGVVFAKIAEKVAKEEVCRR